LKYVHYFKRLENILDYYIFIGCFRSIIACGPSFLMLGSFRPMVHLELSNKNTKACEYQSSAKDEEGIT
jgi:hypothetical protein